MKGISTRNALLNIQPPLLMVLNPFSPSPPPHTAHSSLPPFRRPFTSFFFYRVSPEFIGCPMQRRSREADDESEDETTNRLSFYPPHTQKFDSPPTTLFPLLPFLSLSLSLSQRFQIENLVMMIISENKYLHNYYSTELNQNTIIKFSQNPPGAR